MEKKVIILSIIAGGIILSISSFFIWNYNKNNVSSEVTSQEVINLDEILDEKGRVKEYIAEIVDEVAIPVGYEYVQGNRNSGLVIKNSNNDYYMWVPYNEEAKVEEIEQYYQNTSNKGAIEYENAMSIEIYEGFYISLTQENTNYDMLKELDDEAYGNAKENVKNNSKNSEGINSKLISKQELNQVLYFTQTTLKQTNNTQAGYNIKRSNLSVSSRAGEKVEESQETKLYPGLSVIYLDSYITQKTQRIDGYRGMRIAKYKDTSGTLQEVYIPDGFTVSKNKENILKIHNIQNPNLVYVWVSTKHLDESKDISKSSKEFLLDAFERFIIKNNLQEDGLVSAISDIETRLNPDIEYSIKHFNGFYIAEGEVWIDKDGQLACRTTDTKEYQSTEGEYIRVDSSGDKDILSIVSYSNKVAKSIQGDNKSIISTVAPATAFEIIDGKEANSSDEAAKEVFVDGNKEFAKTGKSETQNGGNVSILDAAKNSQGIGGWTGNLSETTGNFDKNNNIQLETDDKGQDVILVKGADYSTPGSRATGGDTQINAYNQTDINEKQTDTMGIRLCIFLTDINRHADYFEIDIRGNAKLKDINNAPKDLVIPDKVNGREVNSVDCSGCNIIETVDDRVTVYVADNAYKGCTNLKSIEQRFCTGIGESAFENCNQLTKISIGSNYSLEDQICDGAFRNCTSLTQFIAKPVKLTEIRVVNNSMKTVYNKGDKLDLSGGKIEAIYSDGTIETISMEDVLAEVSVLGYNSYSSGLPFIKDKASHVKEQVLAVTYKGVSTDLKVYTIDFSQIEEFKIDTWNVKKEYKYSEEFNKENIVIRYRKQNTNPNETWPELLGDYKELIEVIGYNKNQTGDQKVTVSFKNHANKEVNVKVNEEPVTDISFSEESVSISVDQVGKEYPLKANILPVNASNKKVTWESSNEEVATVTSQDAMPGGTMPGGTMPGGTMPGGTMPGGAMPGGAMPGGTMPGGAMPGGAMPGGTMPGQTEETGGITGILQVKSVGATTITVTTEDGNYKASIIIDVIENTEDAMPEDAMPEDAMPGGTMPGGTMPGGTMPGGTMPGGTMPEDAVPEDAMPGGTMPGGTMPGGTMPGGGTKESEYINYSYVSPSAFAGCTSLRKIEIGTVKEENSEYPLANLLFETLTSLESIIYNDKTYNNPNKSNVTPPRF